MEAIELSVGINNSSGISAWTIKFATLFLFIVIKSATKNVWSNQIGKFSKVDTIWIYRMNLLNTLFLTQKQRSAKLINLNVQLIKNKFFLNTKTILNVIQKVYNSKKIYQIFVYIIMKNI